MIYEEILEKALDTYGVEAQRLMCIEEMSELTKELCKNSRGRMNEEQIAEEIADVLITADQMIMAYDLSKEVKAWRLEKLARLEVRVKEDAEKRSTV